MRRVLLLSVALHAAVGCGDAGDGYDRQPVSGTVTLGGRPLASGMITFSPQAAPEPVATALIRDGAYELPRSEGPVAGPHRVSIWAREATGRQVADAFDPEGVVEEFAEVVPPQYNTRSQLAADVRGGGPNEFDFALDASKPGRDPKKAASTARGRRAR
jgi:hypothetical protein